MTGDNRILDLSYSFDLDAGPRVMNNGSVASVTNNRDPNRTQIYTYDQLNRLATAELSASAPNYWKQVLEYDVWANLKKITVARGSAPDPVHCGKNSDPQSLNRYPYVVNNPTNFLDPLGLWLDDPWPGADPCFGLVGAAHFWCLIENFYQPKPFFPFLVFVCLGTTDCSYYKLRCEDQRVYQKEYYCNFASNFCRGAGNNGVANCIRLCLQEEDNCWQIKSKTAFNICINLLHIECYAKCFSNPACYFI